MKTTLVALSSVLAIALAACSSDSTPAQQQDPGATGTGDTSANTAPDVNPYGVAYPTQNIGTSARSGSTPGNTMQNFKFLGYKDGVVANGLKPMSLADFFDPQVKQYKMIHIQAAGLWCVYCKDEAKKIASLEADMKSRKVAWIVSLAEGATIGLAATDADLQTWIGMFADPYTHFLDPGNHNFGAFYDAAALPWNADIDARTMEIVSASEGEPADILADLDANLAKLAP